jgi:hypothetical protein
MTRRKATQKSYWYSHYEGYERRCQRRLQDDLGVDEFAAEAILHLRSKVIELQSRIRQLETELNAHYESQQTRLSRPREDYYEAAWIEVEIEE